MTSNKKEIIYDIIIKGNHINKTTLLKAGINELEIKEFVKENFLIQTEMNEYQLYTLYDLYYYGLKLLSLKDFKRANTCFKRCHQLDPTNRIFILQLFLKSLKMRDYEMALNSFSQLETIETNEHKHNNNLYLYLLNMISPCKDIYQERLSSIDYESIFPKIKNQENHQQEMNNVRHLIMKFKFRNSIKILNKMIKQNKFGNLEQEVLKELVSQVIEIEKEFKLSLLEHAEDKQYRTIYLLLNEKAKTRYLSNSDTYIFLICDKILKLLHQGVTKEPTITDTECLYTAIQSNNFILAKSINDGIMKTYNSPLDNQIIDVLLSDLNKLIGKIETEQQDQDTKNIPNKDYIKDVEELAYYLKEENISLEEASKKMSIIPERQLLIKLIYARDYYTEEMYLLGDCLVKEVEKSKDKTTRVIQFLNEVRTNKKFYKNRDKQYTRSLSPIKNTY